MKPHEVKVCETIGLQGHTTAVRLCIPDDQLAHAEDLPAWALELPEGAPLPRRQDVLYLNSTSAWAVELVIHERVSRSLTMVEVWLTYMGAGRQRRDPGMRLH